MLVNCVCLVGEKKSGQNKDQFNFLAGKKGKGGKADGGKKKDKKNKNADKVNNTAYIFSILYHKQWLMK